MEQACCPYACCSSPNQPQTISHMFLECPMAATVIGWLCRLWQAVTGHLPDASVATILVASTSEGHCASDALLQTWHRLRLAVLHSIWTAARIAASSTHTSTQASQSSSQSHLASKLALKTIVSMIRHDWVKCTDDVRQLSGVCSSWLRGRDPSMTLQAFRDLWCHHDALASIHTAHTGTEDKLELVGRCPFPSGKQPSRTPDEPEMCTNNDLDCTRRSVHREKSPERGWQSILGPRRPANVAGHVVEHGESTHKPRRTIACMQEDMQAVSGNAA
ncbi:hypothetical protein ABBQ32_000054 [Trebouxia sp. C0010 RCD-2024]